VRRVAEVVSDRGTAAGVQVSLELAEDLPPVLGDPEQLQQVLLNLSVNALQAVGTAGQVTLRTRCQPPGPLSPVGWSEVEVADTGAGISPHNLPHIFEPFFTTKGQIGGTGLGLAISREIIRSHQGEIRVESTPGHGSRFIVSLPWAGAQAEQDAGGVDGHPAPLHG
jgi:signal transduction histidine kinase